MNAASINLDWNIFCVLSNGAQPLIVIPSGPLGKVWNPQISQAAARVVGIVAWGQDLQTAEGLLRYDSYVALTVYK